MKRFLQTITNSTSININHLITFKQFDQLYRIAPPKASLKQIKSLLKGLPISKCRELIQQSPLDKIEQQIAKYLFTKEMLNRSIKSKLWVNSTVGKLDMVPSHSEIQEAISVSQSNIHDPRYYALIMRYYVKTGQFDKAHCIYKPSSETLEQEINLWYLLQTNQMEEGIKLFSKIKHSNPRKIYDILITKYSELKLYNEIQILLNELKTVNVEPYKSTLVKSIPAIEPSRGYRQIMKVYSLWLQQNKYKVCSSSEVSLDFGPYKNLSVPQAQLLFSEHPYSPLDIKRAMIYFHSANYQAEICEELYGMTTDKVCTLLMIEMYHILGMHDKKEALYLMTESRYNK